MHSLHRIAAVGATLTATLAMSVAPVSAASTTIRWVDGDGHAGPGGCGGSAIAATTIQKAVDASNADDRVVVCPGTYVEQVTIRGKRDGLTLESATPYTAVIKSPAHLDAPRDFTYIVFVDRVDDVTIRGFKTIVRTGGSCDNVDATIVAVGSKQTAIRGNRLLAPGTANGNCVQGNGIFVADLVDRSSGPRSSSATIAFNEVRDAVSVGIEVDGYQRAVQASILHNSVRTYFTESFVPTLAPSGGRPKGVEAGIVTYGRVSGEISENVIQGGPSAPDAPTFYSGIEVDGALESAVRMNGPIKISGNTIRRVIVGVGLEDARTVNVRNNDISNAYAGLIVEGTIDSTIARNTVSTKEIGIQLDTESLNDAVSNNDFAGAGGFCRDMSTGAGTAGTGNHWVDNTAIHGSDPDGICLNLR